MAEKKVIKVIWDQDKYCLSMLPNLPWDCFSYPKIIELGNEYILVNTPLKFAPALSLCLLRELPWMRQKVKIVGYTKRVEKNGYCDSDDEGILAILKKFKNRVEFRIAPENLGVPQTKKCR